jgi:hypothetical protein
MKDAQHFQNMAFTITTPRLVSDMSSQIPSYPHTLIEGGVRNVGTRATGMTSSWIPPLVRHAANKVRHLPTALFGLRAL